MSKRLVLWLAFLAVHAVVAMLGWWWPNQPMGDVYLVYEPWSTNALNGHGIVGITEPFVYPVLALVPMIAAHALAWIGGYTVGWAILMVILDAVAFAVLVGTARSRPRVLAAWFWLAFLLVLGPIAMYRIDAVVVPLALLGLLWLTRRPALASALVTLAAWIKVWPAALVLAAVIAVRRRVGVVLAAGGVSVLVAGAVVALGGAAHLFGFIGEQTGRGLQIEAPVSTVYLWQAVAGVEGSFLYYDRDILTFQVTGPGVDAVIAVMTPLLAITVAAVAAIGIVKSARGAAFVRLAPPLAVALVLAFIVVNKVGSPQFESWLIAPLTWWIVLDRRAARVPAILGLVIAGATQLVYPLLYGGVLAAAALPIAVLTARNLLLVVLLAYVVWVLVRVPAPVRALSARPTSIRVP